MRQIDTEMSSGIAWTLEEIIEFIERARGGAIRRTPWEELVEKVSWLTQGFPCALQTVGVGAKLGRARLLGATEQVTETKHLGPPPPEKCHSAGRCNWVGQPNAYLGVGTQLALSEINARIGDRVGLLHVKPTREMRFLRIGAIDLYRRTSGECDLDEGLKNDIRQIPMDSDCIRIYLLDAFISDVFSRKGDPDVYRITSAIGRMFFDDLPEIDGIIYDSVNHVRGACIAMRTSSFDTMQATEAQIIKVTADLGYGIYDFDEEIFADSFRNGVIEWQQRPS